MSPASAQHRSTTASAISSIAIVTSPPGATPTRSARRARPATARPRRGTRAAISSASSSTRSVGPSARRSPAGDRARARRARGTARRAAPSRTRPRGPGRRRPVAARSVGVVEHAGAARARSCADVAGRDEQRLPIGRGRRSGSPRSPTRRSACRRPSPRAARRRTTRRRSDGAQNTVAPRMRVLELTVGDAAEPLDARAVARAQFLGLRTRRRRPTAPRRGRARARRRATPRVPCAARGARRRTPPGGPTASASRSAKRSISMPFHSTT